MENGWEAPTRRLEIISTVIAVDQTRGEAVGRERRWGNAGDAVGGCRGHGGARPQNRLLNAGQMAAEAGGPSCRDSCHAAEGEAEAQGGLSNFKFALLVSNEGCPSSSLVLELPAISTAQGCLCKNQLTFIQCFSCAVIAPSNVPKVIELVRGRCVIQIQ